MTTADLVLTGGKILTLDRHSRTVQALAVRGGRIAALGRDAEIARLIGPDTRRLDLRGRLAVPGLIDGHAHMDREGLKLRWPSLAAARSIDDILEIVEAEVRRTPHGEWIVTMPIGEPPMYEGVPGHLAENRWPTRHDRTGSRPTIPSTSAPSGGTGAIPCPWSPSPIRGRSSARASGATRGRPRHPSRSSATPTATRPASSRRTRPCASGAGRACGRISCGARPGRPPMRRPCSISCGAGAPG